MQRFHTRARPRGAAGPRRAPCGATHNPEALTPINKPCNGRSHQTQTDANSRERTHANRDARTCTCTGGPAAGSGSGGWRWLRLVARWRLVAAAGGAATAGGDGGWRRLVAAAGGDGWWWCGGLWCGGGWWRGAGWWRQLVAAASEGPAAAGGGGCDGGDECSAWCSDLRQRKSAHPEQTSAGGSSAGLDRMCRGRSGVRGTNAPGACDELATSRSCQCRCPPLRLSGAACAVQPAFDAARPERGNRGGQWSVRSILACEGGRRRGHAGRAARRRQAAGTRHLGSARLN